MINIQKLRKYYGTSRGIENVSFDVNPGQVVGFVGPNGSGKSTTIKVLIGLAVADAGTATIDGQTVYNNAQLRKQIGYISSDSIFYKKMTPRNIFEITASIYGCPPSSYVQMARQLDLDLSKSIGALSMGNRKKVGIINALMHQPRYLILDEPTNGLDPLIQKEFFGMVKAARERGATVLVSTHILSDVQNHCDDVVVIREGTVVAHSTIEQMLASGPRRVRMVFGDTVPSLQGLAGAQSLKIEGQVLSGEFDGEMHELLAVVSRHKISDCTIFDCDLDQVVAKYYERSDNE